MASKTTGQRKLHIHQNFALLTHCSAHIEDLSTIAAHNVLQAFLCGLSLQDFSLYLQSPDGQNENALSSFAARQLRTLRLTRIKEYHAINKKRLTKARRFQSLFLHMVDELARQEPNPRPAGKDFSLPLLYTKEKNL